MPNSLVNLFNIAPALTSKIHGLTIAGVEGLFPLADIIAMLSSTGTFLATATGVEELRTGTVNYSVAGNSVVLDIPEIVGVSDATTFTLTGMPAALRPATAKIVPVTITNNGGAAVLSVARIETTGVITIFATAALGAFTAADTKSVGANSVAYTLA